MMEYLGGEDGTRPLPQDQGVRRWVQLKHEEHRVVSGVLYHLWTTPREEERQQLVVPERLRGALLHMVHDDPLAGAHLGPDKAYGKLRDRYWWKGMYRDVHEYCRACTACGSGKGSVDHADFANIPLPAAPFQLVGVDFVGPLPTTGSGNSYILAFSDYLTRWSEAFAVRAADANTAAQVMMEEVVTRHGYPRTLLSDRGSHFCNGVIKRLVELGGTAHVTTPAYRPEMNGLTERFNGTLKGMLKMFVNAAQTDWDRYLPFVLFAYRTAYQSSIRCTPFGMLYGREAELPLDTLLLEPSKEFEDPSDYRNALEVGLKRIYTQARGELDRVHKAREIVQARKRDNGRVERVYKLGERVWVHSQPRTEGGRAAAFKHPYKGPYEVVAAEGKKTWRLKALGPGRSGNELHDHPVVHAQRLKPYYPRPEDPEEPAIPSLVQVEEHMGPLWDGQHENECELCGFGGDLVLCDWCNAVYHDDCAPSDTSGERWGCPDCVQAGAATARAKGALPPPEPRLLDRISSAGGLAPGPPERRVGQRVHTTPGTTAPAALPEEAVAADLERHPRGRSGRRLSVRQQEARLPRLQNQGRVLRHGLRRNANGRQEVQYFVVPAGGGARAATHGSWCAAREVDADLMRRYRGAAPPLQPVEEAAPVLAVKNVSLTLRLPGGGLVGRKPPRTRRGSG
jgi:hypothetical protein